MIGEVVGDRWELIERAGAGGMGVVYRAHDRETGGPAAVKVLMSDATGADRFWQEGDLLAELAHPVVVRYLGRGCTPTGHPYLAMEWLEGEALDERLLRGLLSVGETITLATRVIDALEAAHARGVIHRDIKPSNIFLVGSDAGRTKLLDFGIARASVRTRAMTRTGAVVGTVGYMAPEQAAGARDVDARADLFSLGCVLYECLAGEPAFAGAQPLAVLAKVLREDPPPLDLLRPDTPPELASLVSRLLAKRRDERPASAVAVRAALGSLGSASAGAHVAAPPSLVRRSEQRMLSAILVDASGGLVEQATLTPDELEEDSQRARQIAEKYGGEATMLVNHHVLVTLSTPLGVRDQALRAAACALELGAAFPGAAVALATGRAEATGRAPVGEVIERAVGLLAGAAQGAVLDELTARFAEARFEIRADGDRWRLLGALVAGEHDTRRLLGRATPCVGRRKELALLEATLEECVEERVARVVVVTAPAGMGKSRLRHELVQRVTERAPEVLVLRGRGELIAGASSMALARQLVRAAIAAPDDAGDEEVLELLDARAATLAPDDAHARELLAELLGIRRPQPPSEALRAARDDPRLMAERLKEAFASWLAAEASRAPVLVVVDDLHWVDETSLRYLDAALGRAPIMVLALGRPDEASRFADLGVRAGRQDVRLSPLSARAAAELVHAALPDGVDEHTVRRVVERADGNAFYLEELVRHVAEGGGDALPETIVAMAQSRIERLEPDARRVLRAASVFGPVFHDGGVAALLGESARPERTREWLAILVDREILADRRESRFAGQREIGFRHALLREAAYAMLTEADRVAGHRLAGEWLESAGERDPVALASHFEHGKDGERAVRYFVAASRVAAAVCAHERAAAMLGRSLAIVAERPPGRERDGAELALLLEEMPSLRAIHGYSGRSVVSVLDRAQRLAHDLEDSQALFQVLRSLCSLRFVAGDLRGCLDTAHKMMRLAAGLPELAPESHHVLAGALMHAGELARSIRHFEAARRGYDPKDSPRQLFVFGSDLGVFNCAWEAHALWLYGLEDRALASAREAVRTARALGHAYSEALAQAYAAALHYMRRDREACARAAEAVRALCTRHGFAYYGHWGTLLGAWADERADARAAAQSMRGALAALDSEGSWARRPMYLAALAEVLARAGRESEALAALEEAGERAETSGDRVWGPEIARLRAEIGAPDGEASARAALELARELRARPLAVRAAVTLAASMRRERGGRQAAALLREVLASMPDSGGSLDRGSAIQVLEELD